MASPGPLLRRREAPPAMAYPDQISAPRNASIPTHMRATAQTGQLPPPYPNIIANISSGPGLYRAAAPSVGLRYRRETEPSGLPAGDLRPCPHRYAGRTIETSETNGRAGWRAGR